MKCKCDILLRKSLVQGYANRRECLDVMYLDVTHYDAAPLRTYVLLTFVLRAYLCDRLMTALSHMHSALSGVSWHPRTMH